MQMTTQGIKASLRSTTTTANLALGTSAIIADGRIITAISIENGQVILELKSEDGNWDEPSEPSADADYDTTGAQVPLILPAMVGNLADSRFRNTSGATAYDYKYWYWGLT